MMIFDVLRLSICVFLVIRARGLAGQGYDGLARRPVDLSSVEFRKMVPEPFAAIVDAHLKDHYFCAEGLARCAKIEHNVRRQVCDLIVAKLAEELTAHLKLYINHLLDERQILKEPQGVIEETLITVQDNVQVLSGFLAFLYDNGAEITELMDTYLLLSDIAAVYGRSSSKESFANALKAKSFESADLPTTVGVHRELFEKHNNSFFPLAQTGYYRNPKFWMKPETLKWKRLMESKSDAAKLVKRKKADPGDVLSFQQRYDQRIVVSTDSAEVFRFYTQVWDAITDTVVDGAKEIFGDFIKLLRLLASTAGPISGENRQHVGAAFSIVADLIKATGSFVRQSCDTYNLTGPKEKMGKPFEDVLKQARQTAKTEAKKLTAERMQLMAAHLEEEADKILKIHSDRSENTTVSEILEDMRSANARIQYIVIIIKPDILL